MTTQTNAEPAPGPDPGRADGLADEPADGPVDVLVPSLGHGLGEALLVDWVAAVGDRVARGDVVALIETDKASTDILAERDGSITAHVVPAGTILRPGDVLYRLAVG